MAAAAPALRSSLTCASSINLNSTGDQQGCSLHKASCSSNALPESRGFSNPHRAVSFSQCGQTSPRPSNPFSQNQVYQGRGKLQKGKRSRGLCVVGSAVASDGVRWWEKEGIPNMKDLHSTQEFVEALSSADDKLVVVEFYASWCGSCRALFPKLCKLAEQYENIKFYKVNFDENKAMCKSLNIKVLPYFHFYRSGEGKLDAFSASISKLQRLKTALATHSADRCSLGPPAAVEGLDLLLDSPASSSSPDVSTPASAL